MVSPLVRLSVVAVAIVACSSDPVAPVQPAQVNAAAIAAARAKWDANQPLEYRFTLERSSMWHSSLVYVHVRDGVIVDQRNVHRSGPALSEDVSVDDLFGKLEMSVSRPGGAVFATFDEIHGYPEAATIDPILNAEDDASGWSIRNFIVISQTGPESRATHRRLLRLR